MMPSTDLRNALPDAWIDRLFGRFASLYGKHWLDMWADVPMADVKDAWSTELAGMTGEQIGKALDHVGKFPPTCPEFVALCRQFPTQRTERSDVVVALPHGKLQPMPEKIRAELHDFIRKHKFG